MPVFGLACHNNPTARSGRGVMCLGVMSVGLAAAVAQAELIATDHFLTGSPANAAAGEYEVTQLRRSTVNGAGQNPTIAGFSGAWTGNVTSGSLAVAQWTAEAAGVETDLAFAAGGRARFSGVDNLQRRVQRTLSPYTASDVYYISVLLTASLGDTDGDGFVGAGFTNAVTDAQLDLGSAASDALRGLMIGAKANGAGADLVVRHRDRLIPDQSVFGAADTTIVSTIDSAGPDGAGVYHVIAKLEVNHAGGDDRITVWVNPSDLSSEAAASASATPVMFQSYSMVTSTDMTQLTLAGLDYSKAVSFDEPRLATTWASVVTVPEPSMLTVLALSSLMCVMRRRRLM